MLIWTIFHGNKTVIIFTARKRSLRSTARQGGMHGGGHAWQEGCVAGEGGVCGRGRAWQGGMCDGGHVWWGGACVADTMRYGQ